jgi:hypothetical protein
VRFVVIQEEHDEHVVISNDSDDQEMSGGYRSNKSQARVKSLPAFESIAMQTNISSLGISSRSA